MKKYFWIVLFFGQLICGYSFANEPTKTSPSNSITEVRVGEIQFPKGGFKGKILKIVRVKSYQYVEFKDNKTGRNLWVATTSDKIRSGDQISIPSGSIMSDFLGREVNMHFDFIIFSEKITRSAAKK